MCDMTAVESHARAVAQMDGVGSDAITSLVTASPDAARDGNVLILVSAVVIMAAILVWRQTRALRAPKPRGSLPLNENRATSV